MLTNPRSDRVQAVRSLSRRSVRARTGEFLAEGPQAVREAVALPARPRPRRLRHRRGGRAVTPAIVAAARDAGSGCTRSTPEVLAAMGDTRVAAGHRGRLPGPGRRPSTTSSRTCRRALVCVLTQRPRPRQRRHGHPRRRRGRRRRRHRQRRAASTSTTARSSARRSDRCCTCRSSSACRVPDDPRSACASAGSGCSRPTAPGTHAPALTPTSTGPTPGCSATRPGACRRRSARLADDVVRVPIHGHAESLNLAMAATICLYASAEARRTSR